MNKVSWFTIGILIAAALKIPLTIGVILGAFLAFKFAPPSSQTNWHYNFHSFSTGAYHQHLFSCLGMLAKADGHVSKKELAYAKQCIEQLGLNYHQVALAKSAFKQGSAGVNIATVANFMRLLKMSNPDLIAAFLHHLEVMINIDPPPSRQQLQILNQLKFNIHQGHYHHHRARQPSMGGQSNLQSAYQTLGVSRDKPLKDIKRAYQKLIGKHHPDRFTSNQEKAAAEEKVKQLHLAWDTIKRHHPTTQSA